MTIHPHILATAIALAIGGSAFAAGGTDQMVSFESADSDQNGSISSAEAQQLLELDQEQFDKADENGDQTLNQAEFDYARTLSEGQTPTTDVGAASGSDAAVVGEMDSEDHQPAGRNFPATDGVSGVDSPPAPHTDTAEAVPEPAGRSAPLTATGTVASEQPPSAAQDVAEPAGRSAPQVTEAEADSDATADGAAVESDRFATLDRNGDGTISRDEASENLQDEWSKTDIDSNEAIDRAEFSAFEQSEHN